MKKLPRLPRPLNLQEKHVSRFWSKVEKIPFYECWIWSGSINNRGYGAFSVDKSPRLAHRISWTFSNGPVPDGKLVLHRCDNRTCVRPSHLFLGNFSDNINDADFKSRGVRGQKLSHKDVRGIRKAWDSKAMSTDFIAELFNISTSHVRRIGRRAHWKSVN